MPIVQRAMNMEPFAKRRSGPLGHLCGGVVLDTSCTKELKLSEHKAIQLGFTASPPMYRDGSSSSYITRRSSVVRWTNTTGLPLMKSRTQTKTLLQQALRHLGSRRHSNRQSLCIQKLLPG
ncbi:TPA: hypothetical protein ACH3X1_006486 [Trebouxia sp. C0004]